MTISLFTFPLSMFTHTLYLSISTQSRYLFTHKRPLYLSTVYTHSSNLSLSLSLSLSLYTRLLLLHSTDSLYLSAHTPTLCTHYLSLTLYRSLYTHSFSLSLHKLLLSTSLHACSLYLYTHTHKHALPLCLSTTFHVLQFSIGVFLFVVYSDNNINFIGGLDALGINSVCPALCY